MVIIGILAIVAGFFCLMNPLAGSVAAETMAGISFLIIGALQTFAAFREDAWGARLWALILGVVGILAGISLLASPIAGVVALTYILAILFIVSGVFKLFAGFGLPSGNLKWVVLLSGAISLILGIMILSNFPGSAVVTLGILLGVELISDGAWLLAVASVPRARA